MNRKDYIELLANSPLPKSAIDKTTQEPDHPEFVSNYETAVLNGFKGNIAYFEKKYKINDLLYTEVGNIRQEIKTLKNDQQTTTASHFGEVKQDIENIQESIGEINQEIEDSKELTNKRINDTNEKMEKSKIALQSKIDILQTNQTNQDKTISNIEKEISDIKYDQTKSEQAIKDKSDKVHKHNTTDIIGLDKEIKKIKQDIEDKPSIEEIKDGLSNFYTKKETYSKKEVDNKIESIPSKGSTTIFTGGKSSINDDVVSSTNTRSSTKIASELAGVTPVRGAITGTLSNQTDLQTALNLKANLASPTFTGTVILPSTTSIGTVSDTEISYLDGVTSAIQTQLDAKFTLPSLTSGSVLFSNGTTIAQDNASLFWDNTNNRLGIGTSTPTEELDIQVNQNGETAFRIANTTSDTAARSTFKIVTNANQRLEASVFSSAFTSSGLQIASSTILNSTGAGGFALGASDAAGVLKLFTGGVGTNNVRVTVDATGLVGIGQTTPTSKLDVTTNSLGVTQTATSGLALVNTTAAAAGAQQISPAIRWRGNGWKTDATAASQTIDFRTDVLPIQGAANPTGAMRFSYSVNGAAFTNAMLISSTGLVNIGSYTTTTPIVTPTEKLVVGGGITAFAADSTDRYILAGSNDLVGNYRYAGLRYDRTNTVAKFGLYLNSGAGESGYISINSTGQVGIGTVAQNTWLSILKDSGNYFNCATTAGSARFSVASTGKVAIGLVGRYPSTNGGQTVTAGSGGSFIGYDNTGDLAYGSATSVTVGRPLDRLLNATSGVVTQRMFDVVGNFAPTSGTALFVGARVLVTVNQTGGASGITRGLYINPTITAAADFRALEISNNSNYAIYQAGASATNYFAGKVGIGVTAPTAVLHLKAGTATASTAPLKFTSGTSLTAAEAGAMEFTTDDYFLTITTGTARKGIVLDDGTRLTSGRVPFATTNGRLIDDADMTFATDTLTVAKVSTGTLINTGVVRLMGYTVATLPAGTIGDTAYVTDALLPTFLGALTGGGAVVTTVFYNGTAWIVA